METPSQRQLARLLAVAALIVAVILLLVIVSSTLSGSGSSSGGKSGTTAAPVNEACLQNGKLRKAFHVQPGDTLRGIAHECGLTQHRLEQLNPGKDPQLLQPGDWVQLH